MSFNCEAPSSINNLFVHLKKIKPEHNGSGCKSSNKCDCKVIS